MSDGGVTSVEQGCTCGGMAACLQCQERDALVAQWKAEAWDEGYEAAEYMARCWGHTDSWESEPSNPYRTTTPPPNLSTSEGDAP